MKKCPFCAEEIQDEAVKCRFCGEFLNKPHGPWYQRTAMIILAFAAVGPLALPLVWLHPRYRTSTKIIVTAAVLFFSYLTGVLVFRSIRSLTEYYKVLF